jgi:hypothetical protein
LKTFPQTIRGAFGTGLIIVALASCKSPNDAPASTLDYGTVTGRVVDTQSQLPIPGATITLGNISTVTAVSDQGGFVLRNVPVGTRNIRIDAIGWQRYVASVTITKDQSTDIGVIALPSSLNR